MTSRPRGWLLGSGSESGRGRAGAGSGGGEDGVERRLFGVADSQGAFRSHAAAVCASAAGLCEALHRAAGQAVWYEYEYHAKRKREADKARRRMERKERMERLLNFRASEGTSCFVLVLCLCPCLYHAPLLLAGPATALSSRTSPMPLWRRGTCCTLPNSIFVSLWLKESSVRVL